MVSRLLLAGTCVNLQALFACSSTLDHRYAVLDLAAANPNLRILDLAHKESRDGSEFLRPTDPLWLESAGPSDSLARIVAVLGSNDELIDLCVGKLECSYLDVRRMLLRFPKLTNLKMKRNCQYISTLDMAALRQDSVMRTRDDNRAEQQDNRTFEDLQLSLKGSQGFLIGLAFLQRCSPSRLTFLQICCRGGTGRTETCTSYNLPRAKNLTHFSLITDSFSTLVNAMLGMIGYPSTLICSDPLEFRRLSIFHLRVRSMDAVYAANVLGHVLNVCPNLKEVDCGEVDGSTLARGPHWKCTTLAVLMLTIVGQSEVLSNAELVAIEKQDRRNKKNEGKSDDESDTDMEDDDKESDIEIIEASSKDQNKGIDTFMEYGSAKNGIDESTENNTSTDCDSDSKEQTSSISSDYDDQRENAHHPPEAKDTAWELYRRIGHLTRLRTLSILRQGHHSGYFSRFVLPTRQSFEQLGSLIDVRQLELVRPFDDTATRDEFDWISDKFPFVSALELRSSPRLTRSLLSST